MCLSISPNVGLAAVVSTVAYANWLLFAGFLYPQPVRYACVGTQQPRRVEAVVTRVLPIREWVTCFPHIPAVGAPPAGLQELQCMQHSPCAQQASGPGE